MIDKIYKKIIFNVKDPVEIEISDELKKQVEDNWNNFVQEKNGYFNGDIFVITNKKENEDIVYEVGKAKYADLVYAKSHKDLTILSLFASILFKTKDDYYVFIRNSHDRVNVIGGLASEEDFENGFFIPEKCLEREVKEEINLNINNKNDVIDYKMKFITGPSNNENVFPLGIVFTGILNYTKKDQIILVFYAFIIQKKNWKIILIIIKLILIAR